MQDITVYEDMLSLVLEIINSILTHRLKNNTQLVYALLLKRDIFAPLRNHARLSELIRQIENTVNHFHARVSEANLKAPSTNEILDLIDQAARTWTSKSLDVSARKHMWIGRLTLLPTDDAWFEIPIWRRARFTGVFRTLCMGIDTSKSIHLLDRGKGAYIARILANEWGAGRYWDDQRTKGAPWS